MAYNEDPDTFAKELGEIGKLRSNSCIRPKEDFTGVTEIKRYYSQLHLLQNRFKIESGDKGPFNFSWSDAYAGNSYTLPDFDYELAAVLYNLGALHSILGATEKRDSSESMKVACTHFQCAAWAFHTLPDRYPKVYTPDISPELMAVMSQICLAQAQECILEKSILDHRKSSIISKVGAQVSDYYFAARIKLESSNARHLTSDILLGGGAPLGEETVMESIGHKNNMNWVRHLEFKLVYHKAVAHLYAGLHTEESQKMGERITHFQASLDKLMDCAKLVTSSAKDSGIWKESLTFANDVIKGKLDNAKKENEFIYHEKVPELESLIELKGASLVKGIGFEVNDPEVAGTDIFGRLVPLEAHEASSLYSEEKAKLLRVIGEEIQSKSNELAIFMSSMSLDEEGVVPKPDEQIALPQELIEVAASLSVKGEDNVTVHLKNAMARIAAVSAEVETSLREIRDCLKDNDEQEQEYLKVMNLTEDNGRKNVGGRGNITEEISRECEKYEGAHKAASDSNSTLHNAIRLHMDNLKLLTLPLEQLQKEIPSLADLDDDSEANIAEVRRILSKVEEMKQQRSKLEQDFRRQVLEDDITKKLVLHKDKEMPEIFEIELQKHDQAMKVLRQNLLAQANIMKALTEVNAKYVNTRRIISELVNSRNEMIGSLVASFYAHEDLLHKATKGLEFYDKLDSNVTKLLHRVQGVVKVQQEERDLILAKHIPPIKHMNDEAVMINSMVNYQPFAPPALTELNSSSTEHDIGLMPSSLPMNSNHDVGSRFGTVSNVAGNEASGALNPDRTTAGTSGKPTLKDYLKIMKENKTDASAAYAAVNNLASISGEHTAISTASNVQSYTSLPAVRPTPVGSECVDEPPVSIYHTPPLNVKTNQQPIAYQAGQNESKMTFTSQQYPIPSAIAEQATNSSHIHTNLYGAQNPLQTGYQSNPNSIHRMTQPLPPVTQSFPMQPQQTGYQPQSGQFVSYQSHSTTTACMTTPNTAQAIRQPLPQVTESFPMQSPQIGYQLQPRGIGNYQNPSTAVACMTNPTTVQSVRQPLPSVTQSFQMPSPQTGCQLQPGLVGNYQTHSTTVASMTNPNTVQSMSQPLPPVTQAFSMQSPQKVYQLQPGPAGHYSAPSNTADCNINPNSVQSMSQTLTPLTQSFPMQSPHTGYQLQPGLVGNYQTPTTVPCMANRNTVQSMSQPPPSVTLAYEMPPSLTGHQLQPSQLLNYQTQTGIGNDSHIQSVLLPMNMIEIRRTL